MTNTIEGYIGCPEHGALYRLEAAPADRPGVFQHVTVALDGGPALGLKTCPADGCGKNLQRVAAPA